MLSTSVTISTTYHFKPAELKVISNLEIPTEHEEQRAFISWWKKSELPLIFAIPNGGQRNKIVAGKMKMEGVERGVPDLFCPALCLWIEFKRQKGGTLSKEQKEWRDHLVDIGYHWILAKGAADAVRQIEDKYNG